MNACAFFRHNSCKIHPCCKSLACRKAYTLTKKCVYEKRFSLYFSWENVSWGRETIFSEKKPINKLWANFEPKLFGPKTLKKTASFRNFFVVFYSYFCYPSIKWLKVEGNRDKIEADSTTGTSYVWMHPSLSLSREETYRNIHCLTFTFLLPCHN